MSELDHIETWELPSSWRYAKLEDIGYGENAIVDGPFGSNLKVSDYVDDSINGVPVLTTKNLEGDYSKDRVRYISQNKFEELKRSQVLPGDILVAKIGSIGKTGIYPTGMKTAIIPANLLKFTLTNSVEFKYVFFYLNCFGFQQFIKLISTATAQPAFNVTKFRKLPIPVPPRNEQHRIVAKIEELFSELDKGIENLKTAQAQLKVYRQALLKHAFEGKLTAQWRKENQDKLEPAEVLLKRIQQEREQRYQQQLADWETNGKQSSKPKAPKPLPPLTAEELAELSELPEGWGWVRLGQLTWLVKDGPHFSPKYSEKGIPFISGGNVRPEGVDFNNTKYISRELHDELSNRCKPEIGDVLYTKGGTTGIARVNTYNVDFNVWVHVAVLKLTSAVKPFYLQHVLNSSFCYSQSQKYTHGVGNQDLGLTRMINIVLAICAKDEQERIINIIDDKMSVIDQVDQTITTALQQAEVLRQSILKKAFSGQLVPQDPNDEPASELLERIQAERVDSQDNWVARRKGKRS
ncbi:MAG: restriction endonuclease subunit S [Nitrosomonas sp.]|uniref:restriction endonuclease subunit S n=1 Tax=Nitrosomonas sp. TaxID=42353 RepID=UPI0025EE1541|nr:restriction endonuclease subunit S [Nitrosomonas sp.]MBY0474814.1 restriction endonuclease subunit S [Nitrosomonas sp.]